MCSLRNVSTLALVISILLGGSAIWYARRSANHAGRAATASEDSATEAKRSADAAEDSALETRRANADQRTPNAVVRWLPHPELRQRWNLNLNVWNPDVAESSPTLAEPRRNFVSPSQDSVFVSVAVRIHIDNKSDTPVNVRFNTLAGQVQVYHELWPDHESDPELINVRAGKVTIDPHIEIDLRLYCGVTLADWLEEDKPVGPKTFDIPISANYEPDGATLNWNLRVEASLLDPSRSNSSGAVLASNLPPNVTLNPMPRTYGTDPT
jgi:hypothetical protein